MKGKQVPAAILLNQDDWGHSYFTLDKPSMLVFEQKLGQVADPLSRAVIINQFVAMVQQGAYK